MSLSSLVLPPATRAAGAPSSTRPRRRPSGEAPPLPYDLGRSGRRWAWTGRRRPRLLGQRHVRLRQHRRPHRHGDPALDRLPPHRQRDGGGPPAREARLPDPHPHPPVGGDPGGPGVPAVPPPDRLPGVRPGDDLGDLTGRRRLRPAPARGGDPRRLDRLLPSLPATGHGGRRRHRAHLRGVPPRPAPGMGQGHGRREPRRARRHPALPRCRPPDRCRDGRHPRRRRHPRGVPGARAHRELPGHLPPGEVGPPRRRRPARRCHPARPARPALPRRRRHQALRPGRLGRIHPAADHPGRRHEAVRQALRQEPPALGPLVQAVPHAGLRPAGGRVDVLVGPPAGPVRGLPPPPHARRRHPDRTAVRVHRDHARAGVPAGDRVLRGRHRDRRGRGGRHHHRRRPGRSSASCGTPAWPTAT